MSYCGIFYVPQERSEAEAKYTVIYRHRNEYPVSVMCCFFQASRSGYYDFAHRLGKPEKNAALAEIIAEQREQLSYLWIPQDVAGAEKTGHLPQSQDYPAYYGEIRLACRNPPSQKVAVDGTAVPQV